MNTSIHPGMIETIKDKTVAATEGTGHVIEKAVDTTAKVLTTTVKDTKEVVVGTEHATAAVVGSAVKATGKVGTAVVDTVRHPVTGPIDSKKVEPKGPELAAAKN